MIAAPVLVLLAILGIFLMRGFRGGTTTGVEERFRSTRDRTLRFDGAKTTVLYTGLELHRFRKTSFFDSRCPMTAVKICADKRGRHFLWVYCPPDDAAPTLRRLDNVELRQLLQDEQAILAKVRAQRVSPEAPRR